MSEVAASWVGPGSKAAWGGPAGPLGLVRGEERRGPKPSRLQCPGSGSAPSERLPNSREAADPGCPIKPTQPGEQEMKKQSERLGERAGATGAGPSTSIARSRGAAACEPRRPAGEGHARGGPVTSPGPGSQSPHSSPSPRAGIWEYPSRGSPQPRGARSPRRRQSPDWRLRAAPEAQTFLLGGKMAGLGKQRKLGPGPESGVCGSQVRAGSFVGVARRLCRPARSPLGEKQSTTPGASDARAPTCGPAAPGPAWFGAEAWAGTFMTLRCSLLSATLRVHLLSPRNPVLPSPDWLALGRRRVGRFVPSPRQALSPSPPPPPHILYPENRPRPGAVTGTALPRRWCAAAARAARG
ncbi:hypothetical protein HPG69_014280 [Diceros bicornis minor]|uniref:Uncharacterized protein n=1 Tax=Diceros bicornis minor TaxID=77932 RepID=A0A7J7EVT6_DICBM|nr:hypothetical protein HPG69_014280 [Diceros bicornis minor]